MAEKQLLQEFTLLEYDPDEVKKSLKEGRNIILSGVMQRADAKNANNRIYPRPILEREVGRFQELVEQNRALGELDHPCLNRCKIMTYEGWKWIDKISEDEWVYTLNTETESIGLQKIQRKIHEKYSGPMYHFKGRSIDIKMTPNHRVLLRGRSDQGSQGKLFFRTAEELFNMKDRHWSIPKRGEWAGANEEYFVLRGAELKENTKLPHEARKKYQSNTKIRSDVWMQFMGYWLSEGGSGKHDYGVMIYQKNSQVKDNIRKTLSEFPNDIIWKEQTDKNGKSVFRVADARLHSYLKPLGICYDKYIPEELKQCSPELLSYLFEAFVEGDGRIIGDKEKGYVKTDVFSTFKKLIDDLHEILVKMGKAGNVWTEIPQDRMIEGRLIKAENSQPLHFLRVNTTKGIYLDDRFISIEKVDYDDYIHCVTVPNGTFMAMDENGHTFWTGNSDAIVNLRNVSHRVNEIFWEGGDLKGKIEILNTSAGKELRSLVEDNVLVGISSRGLGSTSRTDENVDMVNDDFQLVAFDVVSNPSTFGSFISPMKESKDYHIREDGRIQRLFNINRQLDELIRAGNK